MSNVAHTAFLLPWLMRNVAHTSLPGKMDGGGGVPCICLPGTWAAILPGGTQCSLPGYTDLPDRHAGDHAANSAGQALPR